MSPLEDVDHAVVMCQFWAPEYLVEGSIERACDKCGARIGLSPASQKMLGRVREILLCPPCAFLNAPDQDVSIPDEVKEELKSVMGERMTAKVALEVEGRPMREVMVEGLRRAACPECDWWETWLGGDWAFAAGLWHVYDEHRVLWEQLVAAVFRGLTEPPVKRPVGRPVYKSEVA